MSNRHPTQGGKGKAAKDRPPKPVIYTPSITCSCGRVHQLHVTPEMLQIIIPCPCGALIRWYPSKSTLETVEL